MSDALQEAIASLRLAVHAFEREALIAYPDPQDRLKSLLAVTDTIGSPRQIKLRNCPDEYRTQWYAYLAGERTQLDRRAVRFLCWDPEIACTVRFHTYLDQIKVELTARSLQGLLTSLHQRWSNALAEGPVGTSVRHRISTYTGLNRRIAMWQRDIRRVAGANAPALFGEYLAEEGRPVAEVATASGLVEDSAFMRLAVKFALSRCAEQCDGRSHSNLFLVDQLIGWRIWDQSEFKDLLCEWILAPRTKQSENLRESIKRLALDRLGDPRLPRNAASWLGVRSDGRAEFLKWLSLEDIAFFFEHVLPSGSDPNGRKAFWLKYVGQVKRSRPLLCRDDQSRLINYEIRSGQKGGHYGRISGTTSAFLLDFGELLVIEFSAVGNACYVYDRQGAANVIDDFWRVGSFSVSELKRKHSAVGRLFHTPGWEMKMARALAQRGIRPES
jgi:hypothetical protein